MTDVDTRLRALIDDVERHLQTASQGAALCALSRSGQPVNAVKFYEGAWAALTAARRQLRASPDALDAVLREWREDLANREAIGAHANWIAYCSGGVEYLERFHESTNHHS